MKTNVLQRRKPYKPRYQFKEPRFLAKASAREEAQWHGSVYYWWWRCLRLNESYRRCCERGGRGRMARLYRNFGDVFATDFRTWWLEEDRGARLFAEPPAPVWLRELRDVSEWDAAWTRDSVMVVAVPLYDTKQRLHKKFADLLKHCQGRLSDGPKKRESNALYPAYPKFSVPAIKKMVLVCEMRADRPEMTLARIGEKLKLLPTAMPNPKDTPQAASDKRNTMAATVSRYLKKAKLMIDNAGCGRFPCVE